MQENREETARRKFICKSFFIDDKEIKAFDVFKQVK